MWVVIGADSNQQEINLGQVLQTFNMLYEYSFR